MDYYGVHFQYISNIESTIINDILSSELGEVGFESFEEKENGLSAYIPGNLYNPELLDQRLTNFPIEGVQFIREVELIKDKDWNEEWEKNYFKPIRIGKECIIRASFHPEETGFKHTLLIDPKMAFGTGNHDTTRLMIMELLRTDLSGKKVLDMGCGTAVLTILAKKSGSAETVAIDIDEWAFENAKENIKLNQVTGIDIRCGGVEKISANERFDLILANINRNILLKDMHAYASALNRGGRLYMSGFYTEDIPVLEKEIIRNGLVIDKKEESNRWCLIACTSSH